MNVTKRILALDVGDARIGLAISDPLAMFAQPLTTIERKDGGFYQKIVEEVQANNVGTIVVGLPKELSGAIGAQAQVVQRFVDKLRNHLHNAGLLESCAIVFWDERFTTVAAEQVIRGTKLKNSARSAALDRVSASLILEGYLMQLSPAVASS